MKVIFIKDVKKQAKKDEIKEIKDGYGKYLISEGLAVLYTTKSISVLNNEINNRKNQELVLISEYNIIRKKLENKELVFKVKTGENGKVFGSISSKQISEELKKMGHEIDKKKIIIKNDINLLGVHNVEIMLHKEVKFNIKIKLEC